MGVLEDVLKSPTFRALFPTIASRTRPIALTPQHVTLLTDNGKSEVVFFPLQLAAEECDTGGELPTLNYCTHPHLQKNREKSVADSQAEPSESCLQVI